MYTYYYDILTQFYHLLFENNKLKTKQLVHEVFDIERSINKHINNEYKTFDYNHKSYQYLQIFKKLTLCDDFIFIARKHVNSQNKQTNYKKWRWNNWYTKITKQLYKLIFEQNENKFKLINNDWIKKLIDNYNIIMYDDILNQNNIENIVWHNDFFVCIYKYLQRVIEFKYPQNNIYQNNLFKSQHKYQQ